MNETAEQAFHEMYAALGSSRDAALWKSLTRGERRMLAIAAELPADIAARPWGQISNRNQGLLIEAMVRASRWACRLVEKSSRRREVAA